VFVLPPSAEVLMERLKGRNTENRDLLRKRLTRASDELAAVAEYDYAIVNEDLDTAVEQVSAILHGKADDRLVSRQGKLPSFIEQLRRDVVKAAGRI
jgi:guanylate kinase